MLSENNIQGITDFSFLQEVGLVFQGWGEGGGVPVQFRMPNYKNIFDARLKLEHFFHKRKKSADIVSFNSRGKPAIGQLGVKFSALSKRGPVRTTAWYPKFNGSHFCLSPSSIYRMTGLGSSFGEPFIRISRITLNLPRRSWYYFESFLLPEEVWPLPPPPQKKLFCIFFDPRLVRMTCLSQYARRPS